jgi:DNA modification methylase
MTTAYYRDDAVTLYCGDALDVLPLIASRESIHTMVVDPPFSMPAQQYAGRTKRTQRKWADTSIMAAWWNLFMATATPLIRPDGHLLVFCDDAAYAVFYPAVYARWHNLACLVWDKTVNGMGTAWRASTELIIAARGSNAYWAGGSKGAILRHKPVHHSQRIHDVDKPESLMRELLADVTRPGGLVVDPFAGGGSTLAAARALGLPAVGIELDEANCEAIAERLAQDVLPIAEEASQP